MDGGGMKGDRMRICFVAPFTYPVLAGDRSIQWVGGAEVQQSFIARELARRQHDVSMISMDFGQPDGERVRGVRLINMCRPNQGIKVVRFFHPRLSSLWAAMRRADAQVYYQRASDAYTAMIAAFSRRHGRRSVFAAAHDLDFDPHVPLVRYRRDKVLYRWGMSRVHQVVVQTERQAQRCREVFGRDAVRVPSCYGHEGAAGRPEGVVLWVATVKQIKQPELFLDLAERLPQYRFKMIGGAAPGADQVYFNQLRERASRLGNVEMLGFVPHVDVESHFDGASVLVNTSVSEGFPNTFLQAWARGIPTVSFFDANARLDGTEVGDVVGNLDQMADTVRALKTDAALWRNKGQRAAEYVRRHHGVDRVVDEYEAIFRRILSQP
jgi:glycosyltransferase involved in cell wall biosynthesis